MYGCVHRFKGEDIGPQGRTHLAPSDSHPVSPLAGDPMVPPGPLRPLMAGMEGPRWIRQNRQFAVFPVFSAKLAARQPISPSTAQKTPPLAAPTARCVVERSVPVAKGGVFCAAAS